MPCWNCSKQLTNRNAAPGHPGGTTEDGSLKPLYELSCKIAELCTLKSSVHINTLPVSSTCHNTCEGSVDNICSGKPCSSRKTSGQCEKAWAVCWPLSPVQPGGAWPSIYEPANTSAGRIMDLLCHWFCVMEAQLRFTSSATVNYSSGFWTRETNTRWWDIWCAVLISGCATLIVLANNIDTFEIFPMLIFSLELPERLDKESIRILKRQFSLKAVDSTVSSQWAIFHFLLLTSPASFILSECGVQRLWLIRSSRVWLIPHAC